MRKYSKVFFKTITGSLAYTCLLVGDEVGVYSPPTTAEELSTYSQMNAKLEGYEGSQLGNQMKVDNWWEEAFKFAQNYLKEIDQGNYAQSWGEGDKVIQTIIGKGEWVRGLKKTRKELGKVQSRYLRDKRMTINPNGLQEGVYVVFEYDTSFQNAQDGEEVLVLRRAPGGNWTTIIYQTYQRANPLS